MTQDTEQGTRLDYPTPDTTEGCDDSGYIVSTRTALDGDDEYEVEFSFAGTTCFHSLSDARGAQREYEAALIARALRVATDEEGRDAGWMRKEWVRGVVIENVGLIRLARKRLGVSPASIRATVASQATEYQSIIGEQRAELTATMRYLAEAMSDEELEAAGLARVDDGPHSARHGMYKTALLRIDNKAKSLDEAKILAGRALYDDLPR